jgi:hypothetical protein
LGAAILGVTAPNQSWRFASNFFVSRLDTASLSTSWLDGVLHYYFRDKVDLILCGAPVISARSRTSATTPSPQLPHQDRKTSFGFSNLALPRMERSTDEANIAGTSHLLFKRTC